MQKVVLYIAASIDGFIARPDGNLDWLDNLPNPDQIDHGYKDFLATIGTIIMGRATYEKLLSFGLDWMYAGINTYVVTHNKNYVVNTPATFVLHENLPEFTRNLQQSSSKDIWLVGGGEIVSYFLQHQLLDRIILSVIPIVLGEGIPLFPQKIVETHWQLTQVEHFKSTNVVGLTYDKC
jgi:dihydrofolate reductase